MMTDYASRLRQTRANMLGTDDEQHYWDCHDAAAELDRLNARLAEAERDAARCCDLEREFNKQCEKAYNARAERDRLAKELAEAKRGVSVWESAARNIADDRDRLTLSLAEFIRLYRGQVANDGSYPEHLFDALVGATANETGRRDE